MTSVTGRLSETEQSKPRRRYDKPLYCVIQIALIFLRTGSDNATIIVVQMKAADTKSETECESKMFSMLCIARESIGKLASAR